MDYDHFSFIRHIKESSSKNRQHKKGSKMKTETKTLVKLQNEYIIITCGCLYCLWCLCQSPSVCYCVYHFRENSFIYFACAALINGLKAKDQTTAKANAKKKWIIIMFWNVIGGQFSVCFVEIHIKYNFIQETVKSETSEIQNWTNRKWFP